MEGYGTVENYKRVYGGSAKVEKSKVSDDGNVNIAFSRSIVFPKELIQGFDKEYTEVVPKLEPTKEELDKIEARFD